jgi:hypothetical protein
MDFHMIWKVVACFADPIVSSHRSNSPGTACERKDIFHWRGSFGMSKRISLENYALRYAEVNA